MSGLVGLVNGHAVARDLVRALTRLDDRGYDTAGLAVAGPGFAVRKVVGPAAGLGSHLGDREFAGHAGIANARWTSADRPEGRGAPPQVWGGVAVVHSGLIENHQTLRRDLAALGHGFDTEADSEVLPHLIAAAREAGAGPEAAIRHACDRIEGTYAMAVLFADAPDRVLVARRGSPIVVARGPAGCAVASDPATLGTLADSYATLEDGDIAELSDGQIRIMDGAGHAAERTWRQIGGPEAPGATGDGFEFDTRREIAAQPRALQRTDAGLRGRVLLPAIATAQRLLILASGSALHAAEAVRGHLRDLSGLPCDVAAASEWRDGDASLARGGVAILVCRGGEAGDMLACLDSLRARAVPTLAVVGAPRSRLARGVDMTWPTEEGPERGLAATKSVTAEMLALLRLGAALGAARGVFDAATARLTERAFAEIPLACALAEAAEARYAAIALRIARAERALLVGSGWGAAVAAEGALKLMQLGNIHAVAVPAGEVGHGALALVRPGLPVLVLASPDQNLSRTAAIAEDIRARGGHVVALAEATCSWNLDHVANDVVALPGHGLAQIFAQTVAMQLVAYHTALALGHDVDRPRNLA